MFASHRRSALANFVADTQVSADGAGRRGAAVGQMLPSGMENPDVREKELQRRDRRIGLVLMIGSCLLSAIAVYAIWTLLRGVI